MNKLFELLGVTETEQLKELTTISDKKDNERIYYSLDAITTAILEKKKLTFLYFDYLAKGKREYRKNKERYIVNPLGIVYANENLYLVCFHDKYEDTANYRIDRMDETRVEQVPLTHLAKFDGFDVEKYREEQFSMYSGEKEVVELVFPKELLEVAIDRFGNNIVPVATDDGEYIIRVTVQTSKTFFSWLTTFEGKVWIKSPDKVKENYKKFIENIAKKLK
jgi:predicted DNA-binding transcriptional regulator YafY